MMVAPTFVKSCSPNECEKIRNNEEIEVIHYNISYSK